MKMLIAISVLVMSISISACGGVMKQYKKENVEILSVQQLSSGSTEILYQPTLETMHYCPGASHRQDGGREKVAFVRCDINEKCPVDVAAEKIGQGQWKIVIPSKQDSIDLVFSDGEVRLQ